MLAMVAWKSSGNLSYVWLRYFEQGGRQQVWLCCGSLPNILVILVCIAEWTKDRPKQFVFPLAIQIVKAQSLLGSPVLGSLYAQFDKCIQNVTRELGDMMLWLIHVRVSCKHSYRRGSQYCLQTQWNSLRWSQSNQHRWWLQNKEDKGH